MDGQLHAGVTEPPRPAHRRSIAAELAAECGGVVHRETLAQHGIDRFAVRNEVAAARWFLAGRHTVVIGGREPSGTGRLWHAVWETGAEARLDGAAALIAAGMTGFQPEFIDVTVPAGARAQRVDGVVLHRPRIAVPAQGAGLARVGVEWATIHAAQWAVSDRQAALLVCLPLQQRLTSPPRLLLTWKGVGRSARRPFLDLVMRDVCSGAESLGELDFARMCRRAGLPPPTRQAVRRGSRGRVFLDASWDDVGLVAEIDGGHHFLALNPIDDALRQNDRVVSGDYVLRIPVLGLRLRPELFLDQVRAAYRSLSARPG
ncbi:hypothetical protein HJ588_18365 [Flexivirga sp. ID2601S]|uniref:DUF559 domain-containing protein n=1 Tax=Flexivirga aerilata TaxID=1656889 RepID=A0A849AN62_9MICO|nr:hypothetical protein [Flexivirga aerilata]NNG41227.1 hypothetical protein [Flexivirga aerilata]